ncbi:MAG: TonB-dependent receptor, partial [Candidatus Krumholzibacteriota bacterium]|nr:TonB-dependent receptor [Candidatus Krumholzibacteriota bacterium]
DDPRAQLFHRSGFVSMVELSGRRDRVEDLPFLLSQMVGVRVQQYGGLGSFATVSIRGSSSSQVNVYVDGIPVNDPYLGVTNISDLSLGGVGRVEVYRGFSPPHLGSSAIGGAINLVSADTDMWRGGRALAGVDVLASYGSFDTARQRFTAWLQPSLFRVKLHAGHTSSLGDFSFYDDNGTPVNPGDDTWTTRVNNDGEGYNMLARVDADLGSVATATVTYDAFTRERGVPGLGSFQSTTARSERTRRLGHASIETTPLLGQLRLFGTGFYARSNDRFSDVDAELSLLGQDTDNTIDVYGGRARARWLVPLVPLALDVSHEGRKEEFHPVNHLPQTTEGPDRWRHAQTTALTAELYLFGESIVMNATQRWERYEAEYWEDARFPWLPPTPTGRISDEARTPSAGVRWQAQSWIAVKANVGRYYRLPTFIEMFGEVGSVTGNPDLVPEEGLNRDVGVVLSTKRLGALENMYVEVSYFDNEAENLILFFPNSQYTSRPVNIGAARIRGWEATASTDIAGRFQAAVNYTRFDARDTSDIPFYNGNFLPSRPRGDVNMSLSGLWHLWRLTYEYHHIGANFIDRANLREIPARDLHNLILRMRLPLSGLTFTIESRNLSDNQISDVSPMSGMVALTKLELNDNQISDVSPLSSLKALRSLELSNNQISDVSPLSNLTALTTLTLKNNLIRDVSSLTNLMAL